MKKILLTIDDGPSDNFLPMLVWLQQNKIPASFFCIGHKLKTHRSVVEQHLSLEYPIYNHSYSHVKFNTLRYQQAVCEILYTQSIIDSIYETAILRKDRRFRFPFGISNHKEILKNNGFRCVSWTYDSEDWKDKENSSLPQELVQPQVMLAHDHNPERFELLKKNITMLIDNGWEFT